MPIITTPGQPDPVVAQGSSGTLPPRLQSAFTPTPVKPIQPVQPPADDDIDDDFDLDDDFGDDDETTPVATSTNPAKLGTSLSRMTEEQRRQAITQAFSLVFGRNPTDRDFSYYRFSTLTEDSLIKSLLNLPEHKKLVEKANEHTTLKQSVNELDLQVKQLSTSMDGMKQELVTMQDLLIEKNRYIQQMRGTPDLPQARPEISNGHQPQVLSTQSFPDSQTQSVHVVDTKVLPSPIDDLKNMFKGIFGSRK